MIQATDDITDPVTRVRPEGRGVRQVTWPRQSFLVQERIQHLVFHVGPVFLEPQLVKVRVVGTGPVVHFNRVASVDVANIVLSRVVWRHFKLPHHSRVSQISLHSFASSIQSVKIYILFAEETHPIQDLQYAASKLVGYKKLS